MLCPPPLYFLLDHQLKNRTHCLLVLGSDFYVLVETTGIEPVTSCMSSKHSNRLSYASGFNCLLVYHHKSLSSSGLQRIVEKTENRNSKSRSKKSSAYFTKAAAYAKIKPEAKKRRGFPCTRNLLSVSWL